MATLQRGRIAATVVVLAWLGQSSISGSGPTFRPDWMFTGSSVSSFTILGQASWLAENGEIVGTPKTPGGGWLVLDKSMQDLGFFVSTMCAPGCKSGVLLRAEKIDAGMKGIFVPFDEND